jgi:hypothetical protein
MNECFLPIDIIEEIIYRCHFETVLNLKLTCTKLYHHIQDLKCLQKLSGGIRVNSKFIQTFEDYLKYGSIMTESTLAIKYHCEYLCQIAGYRHNNSNLINLSNHKFSCRDCCNNENNNLYSHQYKIAAAIEGNHIILVEELLKNASSLMKLYAVISSLICHNNGVRDILLQNKFSDKDLSIIALYAIKTLQNDIYFRYQEYVENKGKAIKLAAKHGNIELLNNLSNQIEYDYQDLLKLATNGDQLSVVKWIFDHHEAKIPPCNWCSSQIIRYYVEEQGYTDYETLFKSVIFSEEKIPYVYNLLVNSGITFERMSMLLNNTLKERNITDLSLLKYLNKLIPGAIDFNLLGKKYHNDTEIFKWVQEHGFNDYQNCSPSHNYAIFEICAHHMKDDQDYLVKIMKRLEFASCYEPLDDDEKKILDYLKERGISSTMDFDISSIESDDDSYDNEYSKMSSHLVGVTHLDKKPCLLSFDYPFDVDEGISLEWDEILA